MSQTNPPADPANTDPVTTETAVSTPADPSILTMTAGAAAPPVALAAEEGGGGSSNG